MSLPPETARLADEIKAELAADRDPEDGPVLAREVAERLPEGHQGPYWRSKLEDFFESEGDL